MIIGADTFRAGAVKQANEWANRIGVMFYGSDSCDPASVVYAGLEEAKKNNCDVVLIDTAGRLQNVDETLLVIDASTGQNGISQAKSFKEICNITGIVLTKLDGTAKGGIVLSIKDSVGIPVKFVGFGEKVEDMVAFDIESYIYGLFKEWK